MELLKNLEKDISFLVCVWLLETRASLALGFGAFRLCQEPLGVCFSLSLCLSSRRCFWWLSLSCTLDPLVFLFCGRRKKNSGKSKISVFWKYFFFEKLFYEKLTREVAQLMRGGLGTGLSTLAPLEVRYRNL